MSDFIGVGAHSGSVTFTTSDPGVARHGPIKTDQGHVVHYGDSHLRALRLSTDTGNDGEGVYIGRVGTGAGEGSTLRLESFTDTQRGYLTAQKGMILWNDTSDELQGYDGTSWGGLISAPSGVQGDILYRGATSWEVLSPGGVGQVIESGGTGVDISWGDKTPSSFIPGSVWLPLNSSLPTGVAGSALKAHYVFDRTSNDLNDRSGNGVDLSLVAGTKAYNTISDLPFLMFSGAEEYEAAINAAVQLTGALTIELIVMCHAFGGIGTLINVGAPTLVSATNILWMLQVNGASCELYHNNGNHAPVFFNDISIMFGEPIHLVCARASDGVTCRYYINGEQVGPVATASGAPSGGSSSYLGLGKYNYANSQPFYGGMNSIRVLDVEYTAAQVAESYAATQQESIDSSFKPVSLPWTYFDDVTPTGFTGTLEALYQFDDTVEHLNDRSGNGHDLSVNGTQVFSVYDNYGEPLVGAGFYGGNSYSEGYTAGLAITGDLVIEVLASLYEGGGISGVLISFGGTGEVLATNILYDFYANGSGGSIPHSMGMFFEYGNTGNTQVTSRALKGVGESPVLYQLVRDDTAKTITFYMNGKKVGDSQSYVNSAQGGTSSSFYVGDIAGNLAPLNGSIFTMRILRGVYTDAMVQESYERIRQKGAGYTLPVGSQGDVLYHDGSDWLALPAAIDGQVLTTKGEGQNVQWDNATSKSIIKFKPLDSNLPNGISGANLKARYDFDMGANELKDRTNNGVDLSLIAGTKYYNQVGGLPYLMCNGTERYNSAINTAVHNLGALTVEMILFHNYFIGTQVLLNVGEVGGKSNWALQVSAQEMLSTFQDGVSGYTVDHIPPSMVSPYLLTATRASDGVTWNIYMNGVLVDTAVLGGAATSAPLAFLALGNYSFDGTLQSYLGVNSIRIFDTEFTAGQVRASYDTVSQAVPQAFVTKDQVAFTSLDNVLPTGVPGGALVARYDFDRSVSEFNDLSGNSVNLSVATGSKLYNTQNGLDYLSFNGSYFLTAAVNSAVEMVGALTVEAVVSFNKITSLGALVMVGAGGGNVLWYIGADTNGGIYLFQQSGVGVSQIVQIGSVPIGEPFLLTVVRDVAGTGWSVYINGLLVESGTAGSAAVKTGAPFLHVGANVLVGTEPYTGLLNSMRVFNTAFTAAQVLESYNRVSRRPIRAYDPVFIDGFVARNSIITPATSITIGEGKCRDDADLVNIIQDTGTIEIDGTTVGVNGCDVAVVTGANHYFAYIIAKADGTVGGLLSLSHTSPVLPSGYLYKRLIGSVRYETTRFYNFICEGRGRRKFFRYEENRDTLLRLVSGAAASGGYVDINTGSTGVVIPFSDLFPVITKMARLSLYNTGTVNLSVRPKGSIVANYCQAYDDGWTNVEIYMHPSSPDMAQFYTRVPLGYIEAEGYSIEV